MPSMMGIGKFAENLSGGMLQGATNAAGLELMRQKQDLERQKLAAEQDYKTKHLELLKTHYDALGEENKQKARAALIDSTIKVVQNFGEQTGLNHFNAMAPTLGMQPLQTLKRVSDTQYSITTQPDAKGNTVVGVAGLDPATGKLTFTPGETSEGQLWVKPKTPQEIEGELGAKVRTDAMMGKEIPATSLAAAGVKNPAGASGSLKVGATKETLLQKMALGEEFTPGEQKAWDALRGEDKALLHSSIVAIGQNPDYKDINPTAKVQKVKEFYNAMAKETGIPQLGQEKQAPPAAKGAAPPKTAKPRYIDVRRNPETNEHVGFNATTNIWEKIRHNAETNTWEPIQ